MTYHAGIINESVMNDILTDDFEKKIELDTGIGELLI